MAVLISTSTSNQQNLRQQVTEVPNPLQHEWPGPHDSLSQNFDPSYQQSKDAKYRSPTKGKMCFYDNFRYSCADFKWGNFRQHCQMEYRTGETCGSRFVFETINLADKCTMCEKIERKKRRLAKLQDDFRRWEHAPDRKASKAKAYAEMLEVNQEIQTLNQERSAKSMRGITSRRG